MNIQKDWKAKLESAYSFMLRYSKIPVWVITPRLLTLVSGHQGTIRIRPKRLDSLNTQCSMAVTGVRKKNQIHKKHNFAVELLYCKYQNQVKNEVIHCTDRNILVNFLQVVMYLAVLDRRRNFHLRP